MLEDDCPRRPKRSPSRHRRGYTLVELLVVISIIVALVGILMPAFQVARESSRRTQCLNNIRQVGQAIVGYDSATSSLPGWRNRVGNYPSTTSWTVPILPQLGNQEAYDWFDKYAVGADPINDKVVPVFLCPTGAGDARRNSTAPLSYAVNAGTGTERTASGSNSFTATGNRQFVADGVFHDRVGYDANANGSYEDAGDFYPSSTSLDDVNSGSGGSSTLMIAERSGRFVDVGVDWPAAPAVVLSGSSNARATSHVFMHPPALGAGQVPAASSVYRVVNPSKQHATTGNAWALRYPTSQHRGDGAVVVFCDGHTLFLSGKIDSWVYGQLLTARKSGLSPRAATWQTYDHDNNAGTAAVTYVLSEDDVVLR